ncbi:hypothetical protein BS78_10G235400 [Paspalum vaginatum]|nr:hypothetical protein BS78_10G235400 [Paspalum vaginatum]
MRFVQYTVDRRVADLRVESRKKSDLPSFPVPKSSRHLERLSLRNFRISNQYYHADCPKFLALVVIQLHHCSISNNTAFEKMLEWSPSLLTLDLRGCTFVDRWEDMPKRLVMPPNLRTLTIAECVSDERSRYRPFRFRWKARLDSVHVPSLRSFRYSGDFIDSPFTLPRAAALDDLYILFSHSSSASEKYSDVKLIEYLPEDLSRLNVLTISGNALRGASSLPDGGGPAQLPSLNLHNLRELQLLMFELEAVNLADLYVFLKACPCPNLERLFVQLPESDYKPLEGSIDEAREEPPENGLDNLLMVKFVGFNWHHTAVQLVSFLLRKARSLRKLLLVSAARDLLALEIAQHTVLREARADGKLLLRRFDDAAAPQPYHSEVLSSSSCQ